MLKNYKLNTEMKIIVKLKENNENKSYNNSFDLFNTIYLKLYTSKF